MTGPYNIVDKLSDILYKVDCGRNQSLQVIHCDRMRKCKDQTLFGEIELNESEERMDDEESERRAFGDTEDIDTDQFTQRTSRTRKIKPPVWTKDYVFSTFRNPSTIMAKTKITPGNPPQRYARSVRRI